jgi:hypothetical protein
MFIRLEQSLELIVESFNEYVPEVELLVSIDISQIAPFEVIVPSM